MAARLARTGIVSLVILGVAACSNPDWVGDAPNPDAKSDASTKSAKGDDCVEASEVGGGAGAGGGAASSGGGAKPGIDVDIASLSACCEDKGKAHCVPDEKVPASTRSSLDACSGGGLCIPDSIIEGKTPAACDSGYGDGVCVSLCVKAIADKASLLKQATCGANEVCAPCISPLDGKPTGACELGKVKPQSTPGTLCTPKSKTGSSTPAPSGSSSASPAPSPAPSSGGGNGGAALTACCGGKGACVPETAVPEAQKDKLEQKECADAQLCAPKENIDKNFVPKACKGESLTGGYDGVCLSNCIAFDFLEKAISGQGSCDSDHRCIPCKTPFGTDTGAPGCQ